MISPAGGQDDQALAHVCSQGLGLGHGGVHNSQLLFNLRGLVEDGSKRLGLLLKLSMGRASSMDNRSWGRSAEFRIRSGSPAGDDDEVRVSGADSFEVRLLWRTDLGVLGVRVLLKRLRVRRFGHAGGLHPSASRVSRIPRSNVIFRIDRHICRASLRVLYRDGSCLGRRRSGCRASSARSYG